METDTPIAGDQTHQRLQLDLDLREETLLTTVGMILETAAGISEVIDGNFSAPSGLNGQLFEALLRLGRTDGGRLRMTDIAAQCRATPSAMTRISDRLERLGYAERTSCPSDRRGVYLQITQAGLDAVSAELPRHLDIVRNDVLGVLEPDELQTFERLMRRVRDAVHPHATEGT